MAGNTNPNRQDAAQNIVGYFSDLVLGEDAINTILGLSTYSVDTLIDSNSAILVTERTGYSYLPLWLVIIANMDMSGISGIFTLEHQTDSEDFDWTDYSAALDETDKVVVIYLDGINSKLPPSGSNITIAFPAPSLFSARFSIHGVWIPDTV